MGKGDKRSRKGKIVTGSYGKTRPKHKKKATVAPAVNEKKTKAKDKPVDTDA